MGKERKDSKVVNVDEKGVIVVTVHGHQTRQDVIRLKGFLEKEVASVRSNGGRVRILVDTSLVKAGDLTSGARQEIRNMVANLHTDDKQAVYGSGTLTGFIMFVSKVTGNKINVFTKRQKAYAWLIEKDEEAKKKSYVGLLSGVLVILIVSYVIS